MRVKLLLLATMLSPALWLTSALADALPPVTGVSFDGNSISWDEQEGAEGYNIYINDFNYIDTVVGRTEYVPVINATYFITAFDKSGNYSPLQVITDDVVPLTNSVVVSLGSAGGGSGDEEKGSEGEDNEGEGGTTVDGGNGLNDLVIGPVTDVAFNGQHITWDSLSGAIGYSVYLEGRYLDTVGAVLEYEPVISGSYTIIGFDGMGNFSPRQIIEEDEVPLTNRVDVVLSGSSDGSDPVVTEGPQLPAVMNVSFDGELIKWDPVDGAIGYNIYNINFDYIDTVSAVTQYRPLISGTYYIAGFDNQGGFSPLEVITNDVVPLSNNVQVLIN